MSSHSPQYSITWPIIKSLYKYFGDIFIITISKNKKKKVFIHIVLTHKQGVNGRDYLRVYDWEGEGGSILNY